MQCDKYYMDMFAMHTCNQRSARRYSETFLGRDLEQQGCAASVRH
jgi:hypothetical protein